MRPKNKKRKITIADTFINAYARKLVNRVLLSNRLSYGKYISRFERELAKLHNRQFAIFTNSGTSALQVAVHALKDKFNWKNDDEVLVPAITFIATSNVVIQNNLRPVFVDVDPDYYEIDPKKIEEKICKKTRAIMPVHLFGQPCDMDPILKITRKHKLKMIEDSAQSMFVRYKGQVVGSFGDIACFSTYMAHLIVTVVGGLVATNDANLAVRMKSLFNHGRDSIYISIDDDDIFNNNRQLFKVVDRRFSFIDVGYSYRLTEVEGALGLAQLKLKDEIIRKRQENACYLTKSLSVFQDLLKLPKIRPQTEHAFMLYPIIVTSSRFTREELVHYLESKKIETRYAFPLLSQPIYKKLFGDIEKNYPVARYIARNGFFIGCHQKLSRQDLDYVIEAFTSFFREKLKKQKVRN
jgi:dTDP-4-amino-4,6-dideoxygalactose transaminase